MPSYFGVENGPYSSGYLVANGNVYPAVSGFPGWSSHPDGLRDIPAGSYTHQDGVPLREDQRKSMSDNESDISNFRQFLIIGSGPNGTIPEKRSYTTIDGIAHPNGGSRDGIEMHFDGKPYGTAGCIGYQDPAAKDAIIADPDKSVNVQYLADDEAVKRAIELRLGHLVDWTKIKPPVTPGTSGSSGSGTQSTTKKGKKVETGQPNVLVGPKQRQVIHKQSMLEGGGQVLEGNPTVLVGEGQLPVSRVAHMTTDGSPLADGEATVFLS
jgi:hypothetical protein